MSKHNEQSIKNALQEYMKRYGLQNKVDENRLLQKWPDIAGEFIARYTEELIVKGHCLTIRVNSSVIKHQLLISRDTLINNINELFEREYIKEIKVL